MHTIRLTARLLAVPILLTGALSAPPGAVAGVPGRDAGELPRQQVIRDPRGDGSVSDLVEVRYRTPYRIGGDLRIVTTWANLRRTPRPGTPEQTQMTFMADRSFSGSWQISVDATGDRVVVEDFSTDEETTFERPRRVTVDRTYGRNGRIEVVLSTEWMRGVDHVLMETWGSPFTRGQDKTRESRDLAVGEPR